MWINDHEEKTGKYLLTKTDLPKSVNVTMYYVKNNEIVSTKETETEINEQGIITKDQLINIILKNKYLSTETSTESFNEYAFFRYNLKVATEEVFDYVNEAISIDADKSFNTIKDIQFSPSLSLFNEFNHVVILYKQKPASQNKTKTINFTTSKKRKTRKSH